MATYFGKPPKSPFALPGTYVTPEGKKSYGGGSAWTEKAKQELLKPTKKKGGGSGSSGQSLQEVAAPPETALTPVIEQAKQQTLSEQLKSQQAKPSSTIITPTSLGFSLPYQTKGTMMDYGQTNILSPKTKTGIGTQIGDIFRSGLIFPALGGWGVNIPIGGYTGKEMAAEYESRRGDIAKSFYFRNIAGNNIAGNKIIGLNVPSSNTFVSSYILQKEMRDKSNRIMDAINTIPFQIDVSPDYSHTRLRLESAGVSPKDINIITTTEETKPGYSYVDTSGQAWEISPEMTTTTTFNLANIEFGTAEYGISKYYKETGHPFKAYANLGLGAVGKVGEAISVGFLTSGIGLTGGFATEGGLLGRSLGYIGTTYPKVGNALEFGTKPVIQYIAIGGFAAEKSTGILSSSYKSIIKGQQFELGGTYKMGKQAGLSPWATGILGGGIAVGEYYGFVAGSSAGDISPLKVWSPRVSSSGETLQDVNIISIGEPFSGKYTAVATKLGNKWYAGYAPSSELAKFSPITFEAGIMSETPEAESFMKYYMGKTPEFTMTRNIVSNLRNINIKTKGELKLEGLKDWGKLNPQEQQYFTARLTKEADLDYGEFATGMGMRKITGGLSMQTEGTINRLTGDIDYVLGYKVIPEQEAASWVKDLSKLGEGWGVTKSGVYKSGTKFMDVLTPTEAIPQPMGKFGRYPKLAVFEGTNIPIQKAGQSLTELGSAITTMRVNPLTGQFELGVAAGEEKRIADFFKTGTFLSNIKGGKTGGSLEGFKTYYSTKYPDIDWSKGIVSVSGSSMGGSSASTSQITSIIAGVSSSTSNLKSSSTNQLRSIMASVTSPSSSSFSIPSYSSPSASLISSSISKSLSSSPSFSSSISKSILSSLSSLSSSSSSSRSGSSVSSSSSGFGGGIIAIPPMFPQVGWGEGLGRGFKTSRKYRYTPNIGSVLAGFKMPKMTKGIKFAELTGILPRPMIRGLSSKRRKTSGSKKKKK
jgi:hypothetical protein